jgi:hypothetical protein
MRRLPVLALLVLAAGLRARGSRADDGARASDCPSAADVMAGLGEVLSARGGDAATAGLVIRDYGTTWDIAVRGRVSSYSDPARDCKERARVATVFAALVLEPFDFDHARGNAPEVAREAASPQPTRPFTVELAPLFALAARAEGGNTPMGLGGQARAMLSGEHLGLSLGAEVAAFSKLALGPYGASIIRTALDLSARWSWRMARLGLATELGPYLGLLRVRGTGLLDNRSSTHVEAGARAALLARLGSSRVGPFLALQADLGGRRIDLTVDPGGAIGQAPRLWLGLVLGAALDL